MKSWYSDDLMKRNRIPDTCRQMRCCFREYQNTVLSYLLSFVGRRFTFPTYEIYGGKYLVRGGKTEVGEGTWQPKRMIVLEFETMERLKAWYNSMEYAPLMAMRLKAARTNAVMLEGV